MAEEWYYCIEHKTVEEKLGCRIMDRIGPFPSRAEAEKALERVKERNEAWEEADRAYNKGEDS